MTNKKNTSINTLIFSSSANECEELASQLKNLGLAIRHEQIANSEKLNEQLKQKIWHLALFSSSMDNFPVKQALSLLKSQRTLLPAIYLANEYTEGKRLDMMRLGLNDCVDRENIDLLSWLIKREQKAVASELEAFEANKQILETSKRNELLLDSSKDAIAYIGEGMHIYTNPTYSERFGYDNDDLSALTIMDLIASSDTQKLKDLFKEQAESAEEVESLIQCKKEDGTEFEAMFIVSSAVYDEEPCLQLLVREVADQTELMEKLKEASSIDQVTGLLNRPAFVKKLTGAVESADETGLDSILYFIEIDGYQNYLSEFGISACDELLDSVAKWLTSQTPDDSSKGRISDSSFAILLSESDSLPSELARLLCQEVKNTSFEIAGQTIKITFSIGTVTTTENQLQAGKFLAQANAICNKVKNDGGDGFKIFNPTLDTLLNEKEKAIYDEFLEAKEAGNIKVLYQPMMPLKGSSNRQYLSFFRYLNEKGELILGDGIFSIFEKLGVDAEIDRLSIKTALKELADKDKNKRLKLFTKLSPGTLVTEDLLEWLLDAIEKAVIETNQVVLCVEADIAQSYLNRVKILSEALAGCDIGLCLNNIGVKDKELVAEVKPNYITLSGDFIDTLKSDGSEKVVSLTNITNQNKIMTVATKLEDASTLALIWPLGIDFAMGNYVSKPLESMNYDFTENDF
ncbi:EAL domain-containing protein [Kangiella sp. HZ709]|uniref:EAL domain-containing protein n=1 Tax=Kangiella sp. HZ709 TaxID=2666328 RepID=UPI0012B1497C|nr:EAL domain-containing protein [Kangiella sp. HZ709]MRX28532.1 EAL domain-containing protein [Kangiella sp. HZ709]